MYLPLKCVLYIRDEFEKNLSGYNYKKVDANEYERVYIIEDSYYLYSGILLDDMPVCFNHLEEYNNSDLLECPTEGHNYYDFIVEELSYNEIGFKFNFSAFRRRIENELRLSYLGREIVYCRFRGISRLYWCKDKPTTLEYVDQLLPGLGLKKRYDAWEGVNYNIVVIDVIDSNSNHHYGVGHTLTSPLEYVKKLGRQYIKYGKMGGDNLSVTYDEFCVALMSWKKERKKDRLENHLKYTFYEKKFKEPSKIWRYTESEVDAARNGKFDNYEWYSFMNPDNRWVSELLVYNIVRKIYKDNNVIYQHRPYFLRSPKGGQMSYDVFICGLNVAIEYQGKQHYEPIDYFGGKGAFEELKVRDRVKKELSDKNGIKLVYISYQEEITKELIKKRIES